MAAALYNKYAKDGHADSAGTDVGPEKTMRERAAVIPAAQRVIDDMKELEGIDISDNDIYREFCNLITSTISEANAAHSDKELRFNTEFVPAE